MIQATTSLTRAGAQSDSLKRAWERAHEIRQFEIDLYWKRAAYFWTFLGAAFVAYFAVRGAESHSADSGERQLFITCLGTVFSVVWYFVNRGSKFWQENWESHVDLLEDRITGPLYKIVLYKANMHWGRLAGPYPFSVSKLNQLLSLSVVVLFLILLMLTLHQYYEPALWPIDLFATLMVVWTVGTIIFFWLSGRTEMKWETTGFAFYKKGRKGAQIDDIHAHRRMKRITRA